MEKLIVIDDFMQAFRLYAKHGEVTVASSLALDFQVFLEEEATEAEDDPPTRPWSSIVGIGGVTTFRRI